MTYLCLTENNYIEVIPIKCSSIDCIYILDVGMYGHRHIKTVIVVIDFTIQQYPVTLGSVQSPRWILNGIRRIGCSFT